MTAFREAIVERLLLAALRRRGIDGASAHITHLGWRALRLRGLRIGEAPDLAVDSLRVRYSLGTAMRGQLDVLALRGAWLRGAFEDGGVSFGALDALREGGSSSRVPGVPVRRLSLHDARIQLQTPYGPLELPVALRLRARARLRGPSSAAGRGVEPKLRLDAGAAPFALAVGRPALSFSGETPTVRLRVEGRNDTGAVRALVEVSGGRVQLPEHGLEASGLELLMELDPETLLPHGRLRLERLADATQPARVVPLALDGTVTRDNGGLTAKLRATDRHQHLVVDAAGRYETTRGAGQVVLHLRPLRFVAGGLQPVDVLPAFRGLLTAAEGELEATGVLEWGARRPIGAIDLTLRQLSVKTDAASVEGVNGRIHVQGPWPPSTPAGQRLSFARLDFGLELTDGVFVFGLGPDGGIDLETAHCQVAGGVVRTAGRIDPAAEEQALALAVEAVDLGELLALVDLAGLSGTGLLEGRLPIVRRGGTVALRNAVLAAREAGGRIRYRPAAAIARMAAAQPNLELLLDALDDFRYDVLRVALDGETSGAVEMNLHLGGSNPTLQGGRRVEFNLNLEVRLTDLLRVGRAVRGVPAKIEERVKGFRLESR